MDWTGKLQGFISTDSFTAMNTTDTREEKGGGEKQHIATLEKIAEERRLSLIGHDPGSETFGRKERKYKRAIKGAEAEH